MAYPIPRDSFVQHNNSNSKQQQSEPPVDTGLIRCVCPSTEDDGFTIQCERCLVWQHAFCVHITHANIPDHYLCDQCLKRKRPKLSKRITISKKKFRKLDAAEEETLPKDTKKKRPVKSRIISRYVHPLFREARDRWSSNNRWKQHFHDESSNQGPLLCDHGPFVTMDATTMYTKGVLMDTPVSNQGLFAARPIPALRYLMEVTGDILLKSEFKFDPINDFVILGTPLSHIMFYPTLDLCIDTRQFGNKARYIRRSCHPNAELRNVVLPQSREDKTIHLGLFARHAIEKGQEVTISWNWQRGHISWKESMNWHQQHKQKNGQHDANEHQVIDEEEERRRKSTIKNMLDRFEKEFGVCACQNKRRCLIEHLKRQCAPPKEKPVIRSPSVNLISNKGGRRKSSVILLKPKSLPPQPVRLEEKRIKPHPILYTPKTVSKDTSDDELLDVEGDIDIGDELPAPLDNAPPLLDDHSSDEENADLSSLSSLSSLSVFEDSANDNSDEDEGTRARPRKKKSSSRHHHHHKSTKQYTIASASTTNNTLQPPKSTDTPTPTEKPTAPLPRKKLWMRDYLSKHSNSDALTKPAVSTDAEPSQETAVKADLSTIHSTSENKVIAESATDTADVQSNQVTDVVAHQKTESKEPMQDVVKVELDTKLTAMDTDAVMTGAPHENEQTGSMVQEHEEDEINVMQDVDAIMADAETVDVTHVEEANVFDIDDGELSDASTVLLDQEELEQVYRNKNIPSATDSKAPAMTDEEAPHVEQDASQQSSQRHL
ncbi:uncharacterized protein ATC70_010532 [Mucor velutinosus]|uniref:SET domain-containing protein n=1 Tax=Mucor velutinosus TaxID=708070 RepID=A0AAN7DDS9_9FUNG|nr:hypothetical protein ATC70_010532 [Mucor velutinosus]